ncbi:MAG: hypothetical protein KDK41_02250 [Leptospiraceae bacterium]|nr:hypothetical protein [Leptospiraceae bacterium]
MKVKVLSISLVFLLSFSASAESNPALTKLSEKIEKVVMNQILKDLQDNDYESYILLSAMWQSIRNQSESGIDKSLQNLLIEKGLIYTLYSNGYRYTEAGEAFTFFSYEFFGDLQRESPEYLKMICDRYDYMISASDLVNTYFLPDSYFKIRTLLNDVKYKSRGDSTDSAEIARKMALYMLRTNYISFQDRASLEVAAKFEKFVADLKVYLDFNFEQRAAYKQFDDTGLHKSVSKSVRKNINSLEYHKWIKKHSSVVEMKEIYLEMISYIVRVMFSSDQESATSYTIARFPVLSKLLQRMDSSLKIKDNSLISIREALYTRLKGISRTREPVQYAAIASHYMFTSNLIENARSIVQLYQQSGSFYEMVNANYGYHFKQYLVSPWFRNFYRRDWFRDEFNKEDDRYPDFYNKMQINALMTDYIIKRDDNRLVKNFKKYAWKSMITEKDPDFIKQTEKADSLSSRFGLNKNEKLLVDKTLAYVMGMTSLSELIVATKQYIKTETDLNKNKPDFLIKFENHIEEKSFSGAPFLQAYYITIAKALVPGGNLANLEDSLLQLQPNLVSEALSWSKDDIFARYAVRFDYKVPMVGSSVRSILTLISENNTHSFRSSLLTTYNQSLDSSIHLLPGKSKAVSEPFLRTAMNSVVEGKQVSMNEYTNIAVQSLQGLEETNYWLHFSLGFAVAHFVPLDNSTGANRVYINDMIGLDFIGLGYHYFDKKSPPWFGLGIFAGGILDYLISESVKLDTRSLVGGKNYLKTGVYFNFRNPENILLNFGIQAGAAFNLTGEPVYFIASSWNVFDISDFL